MLSRQCQRTREQLTLWSQNKQLWDAERDTAGLTATYWRARRATGRALRPFSIVQLIPDDVFSTGVAAEMASVVALCLVMRQFRVVVWTYDEWAAYLGCCPRTAGTAARELARVGWVEIRPHFAAYSVAAGGLRSKTKHAQIPSTLAPGPLMRLAHAVWMARQGGRDEWNAVRERLDGGDRAVGGLIHSPLPGQPVENCQPDRERSFPEIWSLLNSSSAFPREESAESPSGDLFPQPLGPLPERASGALAGKGEVRVSTEDRGSLPLDVLRAWTSSLGVALQDALQGDFRPRTAPDRGPPAQARWAPPDHVRFRAWIRARERWRSRDDLRRAELREQARQLQLRDWGVDPAGPPPEHLSASQLRVWYGHAAGCLCSVCCAASLEKSAAPTPRPSDFKSPDHSSRCMCQLCCQVYA